MFAPVAQLGLPASGSDPLPGRGDDEVHDRVLNRGVGLEVRGSVGQRA